MNDWLFSEEDYRLIKPAHSVQLSPKASAVLACLLRHEGEIVSVQTVLNEVWQKTHVTPDLVREYVSDLRAALSDDPRNPEYIETVRGRGFRLIRTIPPKTDATEPAQALRQDAGIPLIAVLMPESKDEKTLESLTQGLIAEIINRLTDVHYLGIIMRQTPLSVHDTQDFQAYVKDTQISYCLAFDFRQINAAARINIRLINAQTNASLWGKKFDIDASNPLAAIDDVAVKTVIALTGWQGELHRAEFKSASTKPTETLTAFDHMVLGCDLEMKLDAEDLSRSIWHFERAVELDPTFSRAWLMLALSSRWGFGILPGRDPTFLQRSEQAFEKAYTLAPKDPTNLALMAMVVARKQSLKKAIEMVRRAERLMVADTDGMCCTATAMSALTDDNQRAIEIMDEVQRIFETPPSWYCFAEATVSFMAGQFERCVSSAKSCPPEISAMTFSCLSNALLDNRSEALREYDALLQAFPSFDFDRFAASFPIKCPARLTEYNQAKQILLGFLRAACRSADL